MSTLSGQEIVALHTFFQGNDWVALSDIDRWNKLNQPTMIANPITAAPQVPKPFYASTILPLLSPASLKNVDASSLGPSIVADINTGNAVGVQVWAQMLLAIGAITSAEQTAIVVAVTATEADPTWMAQIPAGPTSTHTLFGGKTWVRPDGSTVNFVPLEDVEAAR